MLRTILVYGLVSGAVIITGIIATMGLKIGGWEAHSSPLLGYLIMLIALSSILIGMKNYRDKVLGGVIRFWPALLLGLGIAFVAAVVYVAVWEAYLAMTHYSFMDQYVAAMLEQKRAAGVTGEAYEKFAAEMEAMSVNYRNPLFRMPMTFIEIFPVGLLVALVSAVLVRFPGFLPARSPVSAG